MADIEKVIKALECCQIVYECKPYEKCPYSNGLECGECDINRLHYDALALLKEQEAKPLRCKTCTMRDKTGFCHRWNREVKDDDYCSFGAWKGC